MKITFPHFGNVYIVAKVFLEELGHTVVPPPVCSKRTLELGVKHSPDMMCLPFKIFIGNYLESVERGADTILITGSCGPCRFGMYSLLQKDILKDLNIDAEIMVIEPIGEGRREFFNNMKRLTNSNNPSDIFKKGKLALKLIKTADELTDLSNYTRAYAKDKNQVNKIMNTYYINATKVKGTEGILNLIKDTEDKLKKVELKENYNPIKIGIIGEIYTIIEPFVNLDVEKKLGELGVLVDKSLTPTKWLEHHVFSYPFGSKSENEKFKLAKPYLEDQVGGHGRETVGSAIYYKNMGYDGVIQILPLNCMPEIVAKSILKSVSKDIDFPILTLIVDEMTGEAGFITRLEAFIDLIAKRKEKQLIG